VFSAKAGKSQLVIGVNGAGLFIADLLVRMMLFVIYPLK